MSNAKYDTFNIKIEKTTRRGKVTVEKCAKFDIIGMDMDNFKLEQLADFLDDLKEVANVYKRSIHEDLWCEIELTVSEYDMTDENWNQIKFDRWEYNGHPANDDGFRSDDNSINIYLSPDTKYTAEHRDLLISVKSASHMIRDLQFI